MESEQVREGGRRAITRRRFVQIGSAALGGLALGGASGCASINQVVSGERIVVDDRGRTVSIPTEAALKRVYFTSPLAEIFCFTVAPDLLGGTCTQYDADQLEFLPEGMGDLIYMGSLSSGGTIDREALMYNDIQLIFSISGTDLTDVNVSDAENLQDQTGIPVVLIDGSFNIIGDTYRFLGECLGRQQRANELADYLEDVYERVTQAVSSVPDDQLKSYYYAEGPEGLQTEPDTSQHSLAFQVARAQNVVTGVSAMSGGGMSNVSLEKVIHWDPEYVISWDFDTRGGAEKLIRTSQDWKSIRAVQEDKVFAMPNIPFAFCDRPPGVNRFMGIQWIANLLYPDYYDVDMVAATQEFYSKCYWRDITDGQARRLLNLD